MNSVLKILVLDDEEYIRDEVGKFLTKRSHVIFKAEKPSVAFQILCKNEIDLVILDMKLPEMDGIAVLKKLKKLYSDIEVIIITGHSDKEVVMQAMRYGAFDFFYKPVSLLEIENSIERTNKYILLNTKLQNMEASYELMTKELNISIGDIVGKSTVIKAVLNKAFKAAKTRDTSVLITGPSGTGKELIARAIHFASERKDACFYPLNCSAIPDTLIESEFFGHKKGSFTGAISDKKGCFEVASGGTLFLDEIGDMSMTAQSKLLRVLEEKKVKKIGSNTEISVDVKIITATNMDLKVAIKNKKFRNDLYYRLNAFDIYLPPLTERKDDVPLLISYYIQYFSKNLRKQISGIEKDILSLLMEYDFPGNIRELKNMIERAVILCDGRKLKKEQFSLYKDTNDQDKNQTEESKELYESLCLDDIEKKAIKIALKKSQYNQSKACELLGISRHSLGRKIKRYGIK